MTAHPCRILIVDDDSDNAVSLEQLLKLYGFQAHHVLDGRAALALPHNPQVVLLDLGLPHMDGCEVARRLKAKAPHLLIIAVTGHNGDEVKEQAHQAGIDLHMLKPVDPALLVRVLKNARDGAA